MFLYICVCVCVYVFHTKYVHALRPVSNKVIVFLVEKDGKVEQQENCPMGDHRSLQS